MRCQVYECDREAIGIFLAEPTKINQQGKPTNIAKCKRCSDFDYKYDTKGSDPYWSFTRVSPEEEAVFLVHES